MGRGRGEGQGQSWQQLCQGQPERTELSVLEAIPPAHSASRDSSAERKTDVTPCFWVQTIGIQERGAARLREPGVPSSARPAALRSALAALVPCISRPLGGPGPWAQAWLRPDVTWGVPNWRAQGGWGALPTHGGRAPPQHPRVPWGCRWPRATEWDCAGGVSRLPLYREGGCRGGSGAPAPTCRGPLSFPAGTAGAGCLLAHPTSRCTPAGSAQKPQETGARGCRQAGTCGPLSAPCCTPIAPAKPPRAEAGGGSAGCRGGWDGDRGAGWGQWRQPR